MGKALFQHAASGQHQPHLGLSVAGNVGEHADLFQQPQRQAVGLVDQQGHAAGAILAGRQVIDQRQTQLTFVHFAVRLAQLVEDGLEQVAARTQAPAGEEGHFQRVFELLGQDLAQQRLTGSRRSHDHGRTFCTLDATGQCLPSGFDARGREIALHLGRGCKWPTRKAEVGVIHDPLSLFSVVRWDALGSRHAGPSRLYTGPFHQIGTILPAAPLVTRK